MCLAGGEAVGRSACGTGRDHELLLRLMLQGDELVGRKEEQGECTDRNVCDVGMPLEDSPPKRRRVRELSS